MRKKYLLLVALLLLVQGCAPKVETPTLFFPELPNVPRLQFLTNISTEKDLGRGGGGLEAFVTGQEVVRGLGRVYALASRPGLLYFSNAQIDAVGIIDFAEKEIRPMAPAGAGTLQQPRGLTVADGLLYVADMGRQQIVVFDAKDKFVRVYGNKELLERPLDVAVYGNRVYVADFPKHVVQVFDRESGELVQTIGGRGREAGKFDRPNHLRVWKDGTLYVVDSHNFRIQKFDPLGNYLHQLGFAGSTPGTFARPKGFDLDRDGFLYAVDAAFENIQVFHDPSQSLTFFFGAFAHAPGFQYLPLALTISYENIEAFKKHVDKNFEVEYLIYQSNSVGNYSLNVYGYGKWIGPPIE